MNKVSSGAGRMRAAAQITQAVEPLDGQRQAREQPSDQQAVCMMMTDMLQIMAVLGVIEPLVLSGKGLARRLVWVRFQPLPIRTAREVFLQAAHPVGFVERVMRRVRRAGLSFSLRPG